MSSWSALWWAIEKLQPWRGAERLIASPSPVGERGVITPRVPPELELLSWKCKTPEVLFEASPRSRWRFEAATKLSEAKWLTHPTERTPWPDLARGGYP